MAKLKLMRPFEQNNRLAEMMVYLNGRPLGTLSNNETKVFDVPTGRHRLKVAVENGGSKARRFSINGLKDKTFVVGSSGKANAPEPLLSGTVLDIFIGGLLLLYYFTVGHKRHLSIEESAFSERLL